MVKLQDSVAMKRTLEILRTSEMCEEQAPEIIKKAVSHFTSLRKLVTTNKNMQEANKDLVDIALAAYSKESIPHDTVSVLEKTKQRFCGVREHRFFKAMNSFDLGKDIAGKFEQIARQSKVHRDLLSQLRREEATVEELKAEPAPSMADKDVLETKMLNSKGMEKMMCLVGLLKKVETSSSEDFKKVNADLIDKIRSGVEQRLQN